MPFKKGDPRPPGAGMQKGQKTTATLIRERLLKAFAKIPPEQWVTTVHKKAPGDALRTLISLLPKQVEGKIDSNINVHVVDRFVEPGESEEE